jgi:hypothetical protein
MLGLLGGSYVIQKNEGGMGFRDFHSFNLAMLAKQSWRLITEPTSLCARVLRAKYTRMVIFSKPNLNKDVLLPGKVF